MLRNTWKWRIDRILEAKVEEGKVTKESQKQFKRVNLIPAAKELYKYRNKLTI